MNLPRLACPQPFNFARKELYLAIAASLCFATPVVAAPLGGKIVGGQGAIAQSGRETTINQATQNLAIDWQSFDVAFDERVQFIQPDSQSVALNRILGNNASQIFGQINANGQVVLVNPYGVYFGESATINVGSLVASGLSINPENFLNGEHTFSALEGTEGAVINHGLINAAIGGSVTLMGQRVENHGLIAANLGAVNLAAGNEAVLTFDSAGSSASK